MPTDVPSSDESLLRLHASGSIGDAAYVDRGDGALVMVWLVTGSNGENLIRAEGPTRDEALWEAVERVAAAGIVEPRPAAVGR